MDFVTLNKRESAIKSPDKKSGAQRGSPIFCRGFFEVWQGRTKFCQGEHAGRTRLRPSLTVFFAK